MAFGRRKVVPAGTLGPSGDPRLDYLAAERRASLVAAAVPINLGDAASWQMFKLGDHRWQWEAWRHYDICGEMRFVVNWVGNAVSRCRMYAAQVTDDGVVGDEATDPRVKLIAETMFGTPAAKAQAQAFFEGGRLEMQAQLAKDVGDLGADDGAYAVVEERPCRMFARRATAEVAPGYQHLTAARLGTVQDEVGIGRAVGQIAPIGEQLRT